MRTLLVLAALVPMTVLSGCTVFGCGGYDGDNDIVMKRESGDTIILCDNGGYAATLADGTMLEGRYDWSSELYGTDGATGAAAFVFSYADDGSMTSAELGARWNVTTLDEVALDHAHVQCTDLETRAWWQ